MRTWTATTTTAAAPEHVMDVLTDPEAAARWAPVPFDIDELDGWRLAAVEGGSEVRASVSALPSGGIAGRLLAEATGALLTAGALETTVSRIAREAKGLS